MAHEEPCVALFGIDEHLGILTATFLGKPFVEIGFEGREGFLGWQHEIRQRIFLGLKILEGPDVHEELFGVYLLDDFPISHPDLYSQVCRCGVLPDFHVDVRSGDLILNGVESFRSRNFIYIEQRLCKVVWS